VLRRVRQERDNAVDAHKELEATYNKLKSKKKEQRKARKERRK
jgi:hypothetical protein